MFGSKYKKEIDKLKKEKNDLIDKLSKTETEKNQYKSFFIEIKNIKDAGGKLLKPNDIFPIGSFINDDDFKKNFSGSIGYLKANNVINHDVEINEQTLEVYKIATHKFVKEYFNFCILNTFDNIDNIKAYKDLTTFA